MRFLEDFCFGVFLGTPYAVLAIIIARYLKQDNYYFWLTLILLFVGIICLLIAEMLSDKRRKENLNWYE